MSKLALQLYTVREECQKDFIKTLEKVSKLGFEGVEFAGFYNTDAKELKKYLEKFNLKAVGSHTPFEDIVYKCDEIISYNKEIGNKNIVCPYYNLKTKEDLDNFINGLKMVIDKYEDNEMTLFYHNHTHEFEKIDNEYIFDILIKSFDSKLKIELDTFWAYSANVNVIEYIEKNLTNLKLLHLKDGIESKPKALGEGKTPIIEIFRNAKKNNIEWIIVENDEPIPNGIEDITRSIMYIKENV